MKGKSWPEHLNVGSITAAGTVWMLAHLQSHEVIIPIPESEGRGAQEVKLKVSYSSHCVSYGPKNEDPIDFEACGWDHLIIDHRSIYRAFHPGRYKLSRQLPRIIETLADRQCLFTGHENWLTVESQQLGYPVGSLYEVYFHLKRIKEEKNTLALIVESAYVPDRTAPGSPQRFKKHEKIRGWKLILKRARNERIRPPSRG